MTLNLTEAEMAVLEALSQKKDLRQDSVTAPGSAHVSGDRCAP